MKMLRKIRNSKRSHDGSKMTIKKCAMAVGISERRWINYENCTSEPSIEIQCKIADLFECSIDTLVGHELVAS